MNIFWGEKKTNAKTMGAKLIKKKINFNYKFLKKHR